MDEDDLDAAVDVLVVVHQFTNGVDELDDGLGADVAGGSLRTEDEHAVRGIQRRVVLHAEVQVQDVEGVEQLTLILVQTLDLNVEDRVGIDLDTLALLDPRGEVDLVGVLDLAQAREHVVGASLGEVREHGEVADPRVGTGDLVEEGGQAGVALLEPAARGHAVGLIVEALRPDGVPLLEGVALDDLRVEGGDAVDGVGRVAGNPGHAHGVSGDGGHVVDGALVEAALGHVDTEATVDLADDLGNAREQAIKDVDVPGLEGLGQNRVVRVGEGLGNNCPGLFPAEAMLVHEDAHEFGDGEDRVGVVELNGVVLGEAVQVGAVVTHVVLDDLLQGGGAEEVLLAHAQDLALERGVVGVQDTGDVHGALTVDDRVGEALGVEGVVVELFDGFGLPQTQGTHVLGAVAGDRDVVGDGAHGQVGVGDDAGALFAAGDEGVALLHPRIRVLSLEAVVEELLEQTVAVQDAVAAHGQIQGGAGVQEAGGEAAEATVTEGGVRLLFENLAKIEAVGGEGFASLLDEAKVRQVVQQGATHEELSGEVVFLTALGVTLGGGGPVVSDLIDDGSGQTLPHLHQSRVFNGAPGGRTHMRGQRLRQIQRHMTSFFVSMPSRQAASPG